MHVVGDTSYVEMRRNISVLARERVYVCIYVCVCVFMYVHVGIAMNKTAWWCQVDVEEPRQDGGADQANRCLACNPQTAAG